MARVLTVGGVDPCGGAGITADARTLHAHGCFALTVASCLTVQNRFGVQAVAPVAPGLLAAALRAACADGPLDAVKLGLFADAATLDAAAEVLAGVAPRLRGAAVVDPVLGTTAGGWQADASLVAAWRRLARTCPAVWTPNLPELAALAPSRGPGELLDLGARAVLVKGGHGDGAEVVDELFQPGRHLAVRRKRADCGPVHGTGCALGSALAARLAQGAELAAAVAAASGWVGATLLAMGPGEGPPRPFAIGAVPPG